MTTQEIVYALISYLLFLGLLWIARAHHSIRLIDASGTVENRPLLLGLQLAGIVLFGCWPALNSWDHYWLVIAGDHPVGWKPAVATGILCVCTVAFASYSARKAQSSVSANVLSRNDPFPGFFPEVYFPVRVLFIISYEGWLRGVILFGGISLLGLPAAIALNIVLYAILHLANGKRETLACFPFGLLLCLLSVWAGAAWPAMAVHAALAVSFESRALIEFYKTQIARS